MNGIPSIHFHLNLLAALCRGNHARCHRDLLLFFKEDVDLLHAAKPAN